MSPRFFDCKRLQRFSDLRWVTALGSPRSGAYLIDAQGQQVFEGGGGGLGHG